MKRRRTSKPNRWEDHYTRRARKEGKTARSVYKLEEIQKKFRVLKKKDRVLDLGCAPGSWLMFAADTVGEKGRVVGIDLQKVKLQLPGHVSVAQADVMELDEHIEASFPDAFDAVLSDMAPSTTGNKFVDTMRSQNLSEAAFAIALRRLAPGGAFVCKVFQGGDFKAFTDQVRRCFKEFKIFKPQSCRKASKEIYIIGKGMKQEGICQVTANGQQ